MAFNHLEFIAFCLNTAPHDNKYVGEKIIDMDIRARVDLVKKAVMKAEEEKAGGNQTLKVFMMPEFFFRGPDGAYGMDDYQKLLTKLQKIVEAPRFRDWLFVFGTIVASSHASRQGRVQWFRKLFHMDKMVKDKQADVEIYNISLVQRGGFTTMRSAHEYAKVVMKRDMSGVDFLGQNPRVRHMDKYIQDRSGPAPIPIQRREVQEREYDGSSVFSYNLGGGQTLTFGLEVCFDHHEGRLMAAVDVPALDILLLPSCGVVFQEDKLSGFAADRGYALHCDGSLSNCITLGFGVGGDDGDGYHSTLYKKVGGVGSVVNMDREVDVDTGNIQVDSIFPPGDKKLRFYPLQDL